MFISVLVTFANTTVKIYLEFSERELFEKMKGIVAIVSGKRWNSCETNNGNLVELSARFWQKVKFKPRYTVQQIH